MLRGHILAHWLQNNISVLLSDVDAFWVRDPMPHLHKLAGSDIVSSTGSFPTFFSDQHGYSGCMGFIYFQATRKVVSLFIPIFLTELLMIRDDQFGLTQAFQMLGFVKQEAVAPQVKNFVSFQGKLVNASDLTVTMLSPQQYIRNCTQDLSGAVILHCHEAPKSWKVEGGKKSLQHKKHMVRYIEGDLQYILNETHSPSNNTQKTKKEYQRTFTLDWGSKPPPYVGGGAGGGGGAGRHNRVQQTMNVGTWCWCPSPPLSLTAVLLTVYCTLFPCSLSSMRWHFSIGCCPRAWYPHMAPWPPGPEMGRSPAWYHLCFIFIALCKFLPLLVNWAPCALNNLALGM